MFHLDNNSGISAMPKPAAQQSSATRWFTEGGGNNSPSWPGQDWFNIVQAELLNVLTAAGIAPEKTAFNQLALAIKAIINKDALLKDNLLSEIRTAGASSQKTARENLDITDATLNKKGLTQLSNAVDSTSEAQSATSKAVKIAMDNANARLAKDRNGADIPNVALFLQNVGLNETLNPSKRVSIGTLGTGPFDGSKPAINIGDSDSGLVFESDGVIGVYANSQKIAELTNTEFKIIGNLSLTNGALLLGGLTHFLRHTAADDAGFAGNNVELASWNGIGLTCTYDNITRIYFNPRTGEIGLRGDLKADGNVRSGNAWLDQTGNLQGSAWGAGVGLKAYLDNTFNRKNTASLDTNGWHRDESTGLITQWGLIDQANGTYNFPRAFPNQCFVVLVTNTNAQGSGVDNAFGYPISNSQFVAGSKNNGGGIGPYPVAFKALGR
ncbi:phage tail protein [Salmonella enterica]|nr:phage tail protein [Salmonella enterica]EBR1443991.1 phage tail protein [Salmonella enterica]HCZ4956643.1 tail fiber protein [Salmonella enterica subsp. enterica serovar Saintpaul str. CFSAN004156]HEP1140163.1 tail fiber protein [Salmonella enterica subsp. enterica serovar Saintpaul str. CFSAN004152]